MIEPFKRAEVPGLGPEGYLISEPNPEANWWFTESWTATREYNGHLMRHTKTGWQYYRPYRAYKSSDKTVLGEDEFGWLPVYPRVNFVRRVLQVLSNTWRLRNSPYLFVDEFEEAESPFTDEYELGEYWLVPQEPGEKFLLVPVDKAEQLSNINSLEIHEIDDPAEVFRMLQEAILPLRDNVYGIIFTGRDGRRVRVRPKDFDWPSYKDTSAL
jgi:hypothetical protein